MSRFQQNYDQAGGFMPLETGAFGDHISPSKGSAAVMDRKTTTPVTCHMLCHVRREKDDMFYWESIPLSTVTFVGWIESVSETSTSRTYWVNDGTGAVELKVWNSGGPAGADSGADHGAGVDHHDANKRHEWREGVYVRVYGNIRSWNNQESIGVFRIRTVMDFNEITFHMLDVVHKVGQIKARLQQAAAATGQLSAAPSGMAGFGGSGGARMSGMGGSGGMSAAQQAVLICITGLNRSRPNEVGASRQEVLQSLRGRFSDADVNQALHHLLENSSIFTTTDEEHFKSIDA